jgi:hypothetical protein
MLTWRCQDANLAQAPAQHLAQPVHARYEWLGTSHNGAHWRSKPLHAMHSVIHASFVRSPRTGNTACAQALSGASAQPPWTPLAFPAPACPSQLSPPCTLGIVS